MQRLLPSPTNSVRFSLAMPLTRETELYRRDLLASGKLLTPQEREAILRPYLPSPKQKLSFKASTASAQRPKPIRDFVKSIVFLFVFKVVHLLFSVYIRIRQYYHALSRRIFAILYYHHRTPELIRKDVKNLKRLPKHLSVILQLEPGEGGAEGLEVLLDNVAEISAWCASIGIPMLSIYERTGALKSYIPTTHRTVASKFHSYFGPKRPSLQVRAPHIPSFLNGDISEDAEHSEGESSNLGMPLYLYATCSIAPLLHCAS